MSLKYKEGCPLVKDLTNQLDVIISNYSKSNRQEIKGICENIRKFRSSFDNTDDLYEIREFFEITLNGLLKDEYAVFDKIVKHYRNEEHLLDLAENGGNVIVMTEDAYNGVPSSEEYKPTTVGDIKKMLEQYPDDMVALGNCEGGVYGSPRFETMSLDDEVLELECIDVPKNYKHKDMKGEKEFLFFQ